MEISVSPGAKERLVQITGPNEENVKLVSFLLTKFLNHLVNVV